MQQIVFILTCVENGWDCIEGVFSSKEAAEAAKLTTYCPDVHVIHERTVGN